MNELFFELIRVAIGTQDSLSHIPTPKEWKALYDMAKKQSLVGVCFAGVQRLGAGGIETTESLEASWNLPEILYLKWMGMAAKIQMRNQTVDEQCAALQKRLAADGLRSCVLKGQGVGQLYAEHLRGLRQSGDIDVWVKESFEQTMAYVHKVAPTKEVNRMHVKLHIFEDTEVEMHFTPVRLKCPWRERKLQDWLDCFDMEKFEMINGFKVPPLEMNVVFILLHIYKHLHNEGIGLRQVMDYYFVLNQIQESTLSMNARYKILDLFEQFGILRFASAIMWIMCKVFGMPEQFMLCEPDEKLGRMILEDIMYRGNFGHGEEKANAKEGPMKRFVRTTKMSMKYLPYFTAEVIWLPWYRLTQRLWMYRYGYK